MEGQIAKFIIPMLKNQTVNSNLHLMLLAKIQATSAEAPLLVSFQPATRADQLKESIMPRFNQDRQHFTPAFLLPRDERFYRQNATFERLKFDERIQNAEEKSLTNDYNRLSPPSRYCQLCKSNYQNYLEHTSSAPHLAKLTECPANEYIHELARKFTSTFPHRRFINKPKPKCKPTKSPKSALQTKFIGRKSPRRRVQATCSRTSNQSTNIVQQTIRASNY